MINFIKTHVFNSFCLTFLLAFLSCASEKKEVENKPDNKPPNVVIIFLDDAGYADYEPFGESDVPTPHVKQLAQEGVMFTNFHVPQAICSASRSALMTGCYPGRTKVFGAHGPKERGLETNFATMGELFQQAGYKTAIFGKWHLGDQPETRPDQRGFDESCGLMYSNDMWKHHPVNPEYWGRFPIQYWKNGKVTIEDVSADDQKNLTRWYTESAVDFIKRNKDQPFLLYVPHSMPHVPIFAGAKFEGKSGKGLYGDVKMELDWSVGEINKALKESGLEDDTIVIFTSDNGPWAAYGNHAGKTPFREAKATSFEGGTRSACIIKYPRKLKANIQSDKMFASIDLLPSLTEVTPLKLPDYTLDGKNVWPIISGDTTAQNPHEYYAFSTGKEFEAVMSGDGRWKLHLNHNYRSLEIAGNDGTSGKYKNKEIGLSLFNMIKDPYESENVIEQYPEIAKQLEGLAIQHRNKFYLPTENGNLN